MVNPISLFTPLTLRSITLRNRIAFPAIQIAHVGRKASHTVPWEGDALLSEITQGKKPSSSTILTRF